MNRNSIFSQNKNFIVITILLAFQTLFASRVAIENGKIYPLLNRKSDKIINYYELKPNETINIKTFEVDTLEVYTRVEMSNKKEVDYKYEIEINNKKLLQKKSARYSNVTRGLNGAMISTYNKFSEEIYNGNTNVRIKNICKQIILLKVGGNNVISEHKVIDYIRFTPDNYGDSRIMKMGDKEYTYYDDKSGKIMLALEGPIVLKVMSRYVFSMDEVNSMDYQFKIFDNQNLIGEYKEKAFRSKKAFLVNEVDKNISNADANVLKFSSGMHHISIQNYSAEMDVIFRFYISKSSIEIEEK